MPVVVVLPPPPTGAVIASAKVIASNVIRVFFDLNGAKVSADPSAYDAASTATNWIVSRLDGGYSPPVGAVQNASKASVDVVLIGSLAPGVEYSVATTAAVRNGTGP